MTKDQARRLRSQKWHHRTTVAKFAHDLERAHITRPQHDEMMAAYENGNEWVLALREAREAGDEFLIAELEAL